MAQRLVQNVSRRWGCVDQLQCPGLIWSTSGTIYRGPPAGLAEKMECVIEVPAISDPCILLQSELQINAHDR